MFQFILSVIFGQNFPGIFLSGIFVSIFECVMNSSDLFIVTINAHPVLGSILIPYLSHEKSPGVIHVDENALLSDLSTMVLDITQRKVVRLAQKITDKELTTLFGEGQTPADFFRGLSSKTLQKKVRPYLDKVQADIISILSKHPIPLYLRDRGVDLLYEHHRINLSHIPLTVRLQCEQTEQYFRYALHFYQQGKRLSLNKAKPYLVISSEPAILIVGKDLWVFKQVRAGRIIPFLDRDYVEAPQEETEKYLRKIIIPMMNEYPIELSGIDLVEKKTDKQARLSLHTSFSSPALELRFLYGERAFSPASQVQPMYTELEKAEGRFYLAFLKRDLEWERLRVNYLLNKGFVQISDSLFQHEALQSEEALIDWINEDRNNLEPLFSLQLADDGISFYIGKIEVSQEIDDKPDWFEVRMQVRIGEYTFPFIRFKKHILNGERRFRLPDGRIALLPEEWFEKYNDLISFGEEKGKEIRIKKIHAGLLDTDSFDESFRRKLETNYQSKEIMPVPPKIKAVLRPYQQAGFSWLMHLAKNHFGGCLADDMGLGKTLQTITLLQQMYDPYPVKISSSKKNAVNPEGQFLLWAEDETNDEGTGQASGGITKTDFSISEEKLPASLIVIPTSLVQNWKKEIRKFSSLRVYTYSGERRIHSIRQVFDRYPIVLVTYGILRRDIDVLENYHYNQIILDESQQIKNPESQTYRAVIRLRGEHRLVLTGTPIENSLKDLWAQFNFINPGLLGSANFFRNLFLIPITKMGDERAQQKLLKIIAPFMLRRTKKQVAPELPELTEEVIYCDMTPEQKERYIKEKNLLRNSLLNEWEKNKLLAINGILRLRQLANHPKMLFEDYTGDSGKMEQILEAYDTLLCEGHKVLLFSSFVSHLDLLALEFKKRGWSYAMLTGSTLKREEEIRKFNENPEVSAFLISLKAGGVGLNLTEADYVFIVDPWWNPAAEMQAESRAHRIGQDKQVFVYRFITSNTIEEKIRLLQEKKSLLANTFVSENDPLQELTDKEWRELFNE